MKNRDKVSNGIFGFLYSHPYLWVALGLIIINLILIFIFAGLFCSLSNGSMNYGEALRYCFTLTLSSDGIYTVQEIFKDNYNVAYALHVFIISVQMVLFSGALIGFVTSIVSEFFDRKMNNRGKLKFKDHIVILNWNSVGPNIIRDIYESDEKHTIVILTNEDREDVITSINDVFISDSVATEENGARIKDGKVRYKNKKLLRYSRKVKVFVKHGDPFSSRYLKECSVAHASSIGILSPGGDQEKLTDDGYSVNDVNSLRLLLSIISIVDNANVVVECETTKMADRINDMVNNMMPDK